MICPRCMQDNTELVGDTHYICKVPTCVDINGKRTQFKIIIDEYIRFPYSEIFINRGKQDFLRKPYLVIIEE